MTIPRRQFIGFHGAFGLVTTAGRGFMRFIYGTLAVIVIVALMVDAYVSPLQQFQPEPKPLTHPYYKDMSWETMLLHYLFGFLIYAAIMLLVLYQDGTIQRLWFRWRWSLWQRYGQPALAGEAPKGWLAGRLARIFEPGQARLDTFYQWLAEGNASFEAGQLEAAVESYRKAALLRPTSVVAQVNRGAALGRLGRHGEALEAFREVLDSDGNNGDARKNAAVALVRTGRPAEAEALLAPHLATHGRDDEAWWLTAWCRATDPKAKADAVAEALERACRLEPTRRAAVADEPAFGPYLTHPAIKSLLASKPTEA
ncbi:tetratricopeptide repeat protein [Nitrospinae bacterium AH_259_B05_G02_I21]|nr:tetratricopeptide repeat protein [Nitrospinae bacterium AH_259_B05_G02_I21]MDA2932240.1 tetratricopeptide repeat protein [Nitrospinae bacterium AH-259-F20]